MKIKLAGPAGRPWKDGERQRHGERERRGEVETELVPRDVCVRAVAERAAAGGRDRQDDRESERRPELRAGGQQRGGEALILAPERLGAARRGGDGGRTQSEAEDHETAEQR